MSTEGLSFEAWLERAGLRRERLNGRQLAVLEAAFRFLEHGEHDYASRRLVEHFLLHADVGLKVAQIARLAKLDRCTSSRHRRCSSSEVTQSIQNRLAGKFPGKLLPRYAGPVAQFLVEHPRATRDEVRDFLEQRWQIRPGYRALDNFLRKYGLDRKTLRGTASPDAVAAKQETTEEASTADIRVLTPSSWNQVLPPRGEFFLPTRSTPVRS
jgi:hypothetical protein